MDAHTMDNSERCIELSHPSLPQFITGCLLMAWLFVSYIPQWARIISRKSAEGLSTLYMLLGSTSGVCAVGNILMLPSSQVDIGCCRGNSPFSCISGLLGMLQVVFGIACFWTVLFLYVFYSEDEADAEMTGRRPSLSGPERTFRRARHAWMVLLLVCAFAFAVLLVSALIRVLGPQYAQAWADGLGVAVAILACVQWVPQILTTWRLRSLGSLSLAYLCLSAPYTWAFGISLAARFGLIGWSTWIVYLLVGTMQFVLIVTGVVFLIRERRNPGEAKRASIRVDFAEWNNSRRSIASSNIAPDERRPLLPQPRSSDGRSPSAQRR